MMNTLRRNRTSLFHRALSSFIALTFIFSLVIPPTNVSAQTVLNLPIPGAMVPISNAFAPSIVKGIYIYPDNPLKFDFLVDTGDTGFEGTALKAESMKLIKYFLAALTISEDQMWVNLSPYEKR